MNEFIFDNALTTFCHSEKPLNLVDICEHKHDGPQEIKSGF